ncbi:hypothetical protein RS75_24145 [Rhizobium nepotum 39/7]|uniref:HTH crp-type domain-containing protein n=1 Tax=Rhizobium nepotum 39/7 TaxID=1368418 RepID=A0ABR5CK80_9HYPH|nr:hypothetical protein RS75_24145 [Rhizobium nepotum 39/7]
MLNVQSEVRAGRLALLMDLTMAQGFVAECLFRLCFVAMRHLFGMSAMELSLPTQKKHQLRQASVDHVGPQLGISRVHRATAVEVAGKILGQHA